jgi:adenosylcobinamide-GDP ribazoletransferase
VHGFLSAVQFLTRVGVPPGEYRIEAAFVWLAPVGLLLGLLLAGVDWGLQHLQFGSLVTSALVVVLWLGLTGGLHADGLMDTCDAVFVHAPPARRLEIMRDPHAGAFGVIGIACVIALKIAALDGLPGGIRPQTLVLAPGLGRWSIAFVSTVFAYGRPSGLGAPLKAAASRPALARASLLPALVCLVFWPLGPILGAVAVATAWLLGRWLMRLLPGLTGDCYGAICELVETVVLVGAAPLAHALA